MTGRIPRHFIDELLARIDIVDLIDQRVPLKRAGKNHQACCPFHNEKSPSFTVSQEKQFYHCFGCGAHGNAISFLMEYENLEFVDAIEDIAGQLNLEVPREQGAQNYSKKPKGTPDDFSLMEKVSRFFQQKLSQNQTALSYLEQRGIESHIIQKFELGFAPNDWDQVLRTFGTQKDTTQSLLDLKLITENDRRKRYDFFRNRIMFPIRDRRGRIVGFGGRVLDNSTPKYLNSPETRIFYKGQELYGLFEARESKHQQLDRVLIVEGYMDVIALAQFGIDYAVASLGTSTTSDHLQRLFRSAKQTVCCYDGDRAGKDAAWRALENALPQLKDGTDLRFLFLPDGEDPDSLIQKEGQSQFEERINNAQPFTQFFFDKLLQDVDITTEAGKSMLFAQSQQLIEKVPSDFYRLELLEKLAQLLGKEVQQLDRFFKTKSDKPVSAPKLKITPMRRVIGLLVQHPSLAKTVPYNPSLVNTKLPGIELLLDLQAVILQKSSVNTAQILEYYRNTPHESAIARLAGWVHEVSDDSLEKEFSETYQFIEDECLNHRAENLLLKAKQGSITPEERQQLNLILRALNQNKSEANAQ
ncbi:DNA primase [Algicola sagamiensis]|uniref:DNA primase n=1 Tax=Algicola sagamiensis TaxID=163869 RepID=UPI0003752E67|nr:DNA primase [Algicola sagamiensis]